MAFALFSPALHLCSKYERILRLEKIGASRRHGNVFDQAYVVHLVSTYGYWAIFFVVSLESAGAPLPGETMLVGAAIYAGQTGGLAIEQVILAAAAGAIIGDNIGYWVGREYGRGLLERHGRLIGVTTSKTAARAIFVHALGRVDRVPGALHRAAARACGLARWR